MLLERYLPSVIQYSEGADLYVADNASTDGSVALIEANFPSIKILQNTENGGFAKGYNDALQSIDADVFCLLNSDVEVTKNWLEPIKEAFINLPEVAIIQPKILDLLRREYFEYAGAAGGFIDQLGYPFAEEGFFKN